MIFYKFLALKAGIRILFFEVVSSSYEFLSTGVQNDKSNYSMFIERL